jgi:chromosome segregation ATPase
MSRNLILSVAIAAISARASTAVHAADQAGAAELKLRESLRATMLQLRNAEAERANLQAAKTELEAKNKELTDQAGTMTKQAAANQAEADKTITDLKAKVDERDREIGELRVTLDKWKVDHKKISDFARTKESQRATLAEKVIVLERQVADQQRKNAAMYKLGIEILDRYEKFGLGTALTAREPFVGLTRVKFENLIQDYGDKLADEKIKPPTPPATSKPKESQ